MRLLPLGAAVLSFTMASLSLAGEKVLHVRQSNPSITVDGIIDPEWVQADSIDDFFQLAQFYGKPTSYRTVAKVLTTSDALYCLMICYEDAASIQSIAGMLDQTGGDIVSIMLDTFNDKQTAYKFAVTASGVRADCRLLDDARNRDYSWDGVWSAAAKIHDWGFVVEMMIPYKSIKYDNQVPSWGLDFDRWVASKNEDTYWCRYEQNEGQRISKFGTLAFDDFRPSASGLNLEIYPVGISKATYLHGNEYDVNPDAGVDIFYNPSEKLTYVLTANPDFAQIEADPFEFNISRYETYYNEKRPFFTGGNEAFMASGKQTNTGFYQPLELFYSRRIGKLLPDGSTVPLTLGTKAYGRFNEWEYGGFYARTAESDFHDNGTAYVEPAASFVSGRVKRQVFENSSAGLLFVGKRTREGTFGVLDLDGAFRTSTWQLSYQIARSIDTAEGGFAGSAGFTMFGESWATLARIRAIGNRFDVSSVGFVPWSGTTESAVLSGPMWYYKEGALQSMLLLFGGLVNYKDSELYTDHEAAIDFNMGFSSNWGYEITLMYGKMKDNGVKYTTVEADFSSWFNLSPRWDGNLQASYSRTYHFSRDYLAGYGFLSASISWIASNALQVGTSYSMYIEGNPAGSIEDITYNARPYFSLTPINDLNVRVYVDNLFVRSTDRMERIIGGFLFSFNFLPKSWIYLAINEIRDRSEQFDGLGSPLPSTLHVADRAAVLKVKYLYYF